MEANKYLQQTEKLQSCEIRRENIQVGQLVFKLYLVEPLRVHTE